MRALKLLLICLTAVFLAGCGEPDIRSKAEAGDPAAQFKLALTYANGEGVPKDAAEAVKWYRKAADQGDVDAQFNLAHMHENGEGVPKDVAEAVKWYRKAADQDDAQAQFNLALMYTKGEGMAKDATEGVKLFRMAAKLGLAEAQYELGVMCAKGEGVAKDDAEAYSWYNLASISYDDARKRRDELEKSLTPEQKARAQQRSTELHKGIEAAKNSIWNEFQVGKKAGK